MKRSELKQIIKEEYSKLLKEDSLNIKQIKRECENHLMQLSVVADTAVHKAGQSGYLGVRGKFIELKQKIKEIQNLLAEIQNN